MKKKLKTLYDVQMYVRTYVRTIILKIRRFGPIRIFDPGLTGQCIFSNKNAPLFLPSVTEKEFVSDDDTRLSVVAGLRLLNDDEDWLN